MRIDKISAGILLVLAVMFSTSALADDTQANATVGTAKLIVDDLAKTQAFYQNMFGMKEVRRYNYDLDTFEETILGFDSGVQLALFAPNSKAEKPLAKSQFPVVLIYTPEFEVVVNRIEEAGYSIRVLDSGELQVAIALDPSGNAVEVFSRPGKYAVGGSKLIVDDRQKAEAFYKQIFNAQSGQLFASPGVYDEVIMKLRSDGAWLALFQPLQEKPLPKSRFPLTVFYTPDFDAVLSRLDREGLGYREIALPTKDRRIVVAQDPAGNAIEIISQ